MIRFSVETEIARPPAEVFAYVTDPSKLETWQTNTVSAEAETDGPLGLGTRLREVHRAPGGRQLTSLVEVSEYQPDSVFGLRMLDGPLPIHARMRLEPIETGTRLRFDASGQPGGVARFVQPVLQFTLKRQFTGYCVTLKQVLEGQAPA